MILSSWEIWPQCTCSARPSGGWFSQATGTSTGTSMRSPEDEGSAWYWVLLWWVEYIWFTEGKGKLGFPSVTYSHHQVMPACHLQEWKKSYKTVNMQMEFSFVGICLLFFNVFSLISLGKNSTTKYTRFFRKLQNISTPKQWERLGNNYTSELWGHTSCLSSSLSNSDQQQLQAQEVTHSTQLEDKRCLAYLLTKLLWVLN